MGTGNDPTTIPTSASGGLMLLLVLVIGGLVFSVGMRVFYRSLRKTAGSVSKAIGGGLSAAGALCYAITLFSMGQTAWAVLCLLATVGFTVYAVPAARMFVRSKIAELRHTEAAPKQPPDRVSHV